MIDWSHALLTPNERVLLARLAVFAGGCALEDAEAVAAGGSVATEDVLDLLSNLVEKSLVVYDPASGRYRLLDTVREYARERLTESGEEPAVRDRHLARFLALAEHAEPGFRGPDTLMWMAQLNRERDNFLSALAWCGSAEHAEDGLLLLDALRMWLCRSSLELGSRVAREALEWPAARARTRGRCLGAYVAATIAYYAGRNEEAIAYGEECLAIAREIDDPLKAIDALVVLGVARMGSGDRTGAREALVDALARSRNLADEVRISDALCNLAEVYTVDGEPGLAIPLCEENLALVRSMGNRHAVGINACNLARNHLVCGSRSSVVPLLREVVSVIDSAMPEQTMQQLLAVCAGLASFDGEWERAARLYGAAEMDLAHRGGTREAAERLFLEPLLARARERLGSAAFEAAERSGRALGYEDAVAEIDEWLSHRESSGERAL
jgi:non-specific serine/threonine protein kinase